MKSTKSYIILIFFDCPDRAGQLSNRMKIQIEPDGQWQSGSIWTVVRVFFTVKAAKNAFKKSYFPLFIY